jgi:hypothetical protein
MQGASVAAQSSVRETERPRQEAGPASRRQAARSSLVPNRESVSEPGPVYCPKKPLDLLAVERPELRFPASCDAYFCAVCGPRKAQQGAALMTWAARKVDRRRLVTLTGLPDDFQRARGQVRLWAHRLRQDGYAWEWAWAIERNPKGTGYHAHGLQHGSYVPQALLQERWGDRIVDVRALSRPGAGVYAVKEALRVSGYVSKGATAGDGTALLEHLGRNGGRSVHWSRGFLHGNTKREALADLRRELSDGEALTWVTVPAGAPAPSLDLVAAVGRRVTTTTEGQDR